MVRFFDNIVSSVSKAFKGENPENSQTTPRVGNSPLKFGEASKAQIEAINKKYGLDENGNKIQ